MTDLPTDVIMEITALHGNMRLKLHDSVKLRSGKDKGKVYFPEQGKQCQAIKAFMKQHKDNK